MAFIFKNTNITSISRYAFRNTGVLDVYFDESPIQIIGPDSGGGFDRYTFQSNNLRKVSFKNCHSLIRINMAAFANNPNCENIDFTGCTALRAINDYAFRGTACTSIDITTCSSLISIASAAFDNSPFLKTFIASELTNLTTLAGGNSDSTGVFTRCPVLESLDFHGCTSLTAIGNYLCNNQDVLLNSIDFSGCTSLQTVGQNAFNGCVALANANFSGCTSLTSINQNAFQNCKILPTITDWDNVKQTVQTFGTNSFYGCTALNMDLSHMPAVTKFDTSSFQNCTTLDTTLEECPALVTIGQSAFNGCTSLGDIDLHGNTSLTTIGDTAFKNAKAVHVNLNNCSALTTIGKSAWNGAKTEEFYMNDCTALTTLPTSTSNDIGAWQNCSLRIFSAQRCNQLTNTGTKSFKDCSSLEQCSFKGCQALTTISNYCFTTIKPSDRICVFDFTDCPSLRLIESYAFQKSRFNKALFKGSVIDTIGLRAFDSASFNQVTIYDVADDTDINLLDFHGSTSLTTIGNSAFESSLTQKVDLSNCPSLTSIGSSAFYKVYGTGWLKMDGTENLTTIGESAFRSFGCKRTASDPQIFANIKAPKLETLGSLAFGNESTNETSCLVIQSFDASGAPLTKIGSRAFCKAFNLKTVSFSNCTDLEKTADGGDATFYQCSKLETADFTGCTSLKQVDKDTFFECTKVNVIGVEDWPVETIGQAAFNMCQAQPTLKFTNSNITTVNNQAFRGCNGCSEIELHFNPAVETAVYHQAFTGCGANTGGCDIKLYCGNIMPTVTPIGNDETSGTGSATWRISFGTNSGTTFHFPIAAEADAKSKARLLENDTKTKRDGTTPTTGNIAWWCCSNGGLTTTTGGTYGNQEARVNLWYTGTPTLAFDL